MALKFLRQKSPAIPDYDIQEEVGRGGMGSVYRAVHMPSGLVVAVKFIRAKIADNPKKRKRFEQEFQAASKLLHPNIVQSLDFSQDSSGAYLVMEFVEGQSLGQLIQREGRLPEDRAVAIISQVAQALHYAHRRGMIHRDVKPDNILLRDNGRVKLTDFGLAKDLFGGGNLTETMTILGTPHFMAPEQYEDAKHVDARCDVYSLGATLYMAVTGQLPFGETRIMSMLLQRVCTGDVTPPRELVPTLSATVDRAICRAMSRNPDHRPTTCLEFLKDLKKTKLRVKPDAAPPADFDGPDRRVTLRHPCEIGTSCSVDPSIHSMEGEEDSWPATVKDLSIGGVALVVTRRFEPGTMIEVDLRTATARPSPTLEARVIHVEPHGFGQWLLGCAFQEPLEARELKTLV